MLNDELPDAELLDDGEVDGEDEVDPLLPEGEVELLLPDDPELPIEPEDDPDEPEPAAIAALETADSANAKSTALLRTFMKGLLAKKS
ncbi:MAG: hypothetical protein ACJ8KA_02525 [Sulfurifustis sp.]